MEGVAETWWVILAGSLEGNGRDRFMKHAWKPSVGGWPGFWKYMVGGVCRWYEDLQRGVGEGGGGGVGSGSLRKSVRGLRKQGEDLACCVWAMAAFASQEAELWSSRMDQRVD